MSKISVIVTAYNQAATIRQTLDSILAQQCIFLVEIIIGNDCSTDETAAICKEYVNKYPELIRVLNHEKNVGVAANWVRCIQAATGSYIAACAADDFWHDTAKLQQQATYLDEHPACGLLYTDYDVLNGQSGRGERSFLEKNKARIITGKNITKALFEGKVGILTLTTLFRKALFDAYAPATDFADFFTLEDWPTWIILSKYSEVHYLPVSTATYRVGHESISNVINLSKAAKRYEREENMYRYLCMMFPEDATYDEAVYKAYIDSVMLSVSFKARNYQSARNVARRIEEKGTHTLRTFIARHRLLFWLFCYAKSTVHALVN